MTFQCFTGECMNSRDMRMRCPYCGRVVVIRHQDIGRHASFECPYCGKILPKGME